MKRIMLMCGPAGSGKSTYIMKHKAPNDIVCSRDAVRFSLLRPEDDYFAHESEVFQTWLKMVQAAIDNPCYPDRTIWVDATHLTPKARRKVLDWLYTENCEITAIYMNISLNKCLEQNAQRLDRARVPDNIIINMYNSFIPPKVGEGKIQKVEVIDI